MSAEIIKQYHFRKPPEIKEQDKMEGSAIQGDCDSAAGIQRVDFQLLEGLVDLLTFQMPPRWSWYSEATVTTGRLPRNDAGGVREFHFFPCHRCLGRTDRRAPRD
ncbi:MAG: hypothetical protein CMJ81_05105 [Planctomycetaceae bacterium]|nr:hypothetical protein [Planctomycetaceae bacterium]